MNTLQDLLLNTRCFCLLTFFFPVKFTPYGQFGKHKQYIYSTIVRIQHYLIKYKLNFQNYLKKIKLRVYCVCEKVRHHPMY